MLTRYLFAVANLVVEHCYSIRQRKSSTSFVDRGKAEGVRRGREENAKGRGKGRKCVFTILATYYFPKKFFGPRPKGYQNLKPQGVPGKCESVGGSIVGVMFYKTVKRFYLYGTCNSRYKGSKFDISSPLTAKP